jgi:hypothetical protein
MASSERQINSQSEPLMPAKIAVSQPTSEPLTPTALYITKSLGYLRIGLGAACLLSPHFTTEIFKFYVANEGTMVTRLFGTREVALGVLLITADDKTTSNGGRRELKRAFWANAACDMMDVLSIAFSVAIGDMEPLPAALLAGCAAMAATMGLLGLKSI